MHFRHILLLMVQSSKYLHGVGVVEPEWVQERLGKIRVLDATLILDPSRSAAKEFTQVNHIDSSFYSVETYSGSSVLQH